MNEFELKSAAYYYYNLLNKNEQTIYRSLLQALLCADSTANLPFPTEQQVVKKIIQFILNDRPDIFWSKYRYEYHTRNNLVVSVLFKYRMQESEIDILKTKIINSYFFRELDYLITSKTTDFEKALITYEYIIKHADYDLLALSDFADSYDYAYNIDGVITKSKAVCAGYAKTFQYFMNRHNIYCTLVAGETSRGRHAWNLINLDGNYYYIDTTWGDPVFANNTQKQPDYISYDFFCITTEDLKKSHNVILDYSMPLCSATKYNYFNYFNMTSDYFSVNNVVSHVLSAYKKGSKEVTIKYTSRVAYLTAKRELFDNNEIFNVLAIAKQTAVNINSSRVSYSLHDDENIIKFKIR